MNTNDEFDNILADALAEYRDAEPLSGLEGRVLRRMQDGPMQRRAWWGWSLAAGLAMALLAIAAWFELRDPPYRPLPTYQASTEQPAVAQPSPNLRTEKDPIAAERVRPDYPEAFLPDTLKQKRRASSKPIPAPAVSSRGEQFPAPAPLTSEERALLALAHTYPEALRTLPGSDKDLAIAPITIQPLTDGSGGNEGDN